MLKDKIKNRQSGILLYGLTPPKVNYGEDRIREIAQKQMIRIDNLDVDGIILYDIQDEASRIDKERPFPFLQTVEPSKYAKEYLHVNKPKIIYKAVGKYEKSELVNWLSDKDISFSVFVGAASKKQKISLSIDEAYEIKRESKEDLILGAVAIPERHRAKNDEHKRALGKMQNGCEFFITQAVYDKEVAKRFLDDYADCIEKNSMKFAPIIFTLTPCGTPKTLEFMKWLGISVPQNLEDEMINSKDILEKSIRLCEENFKFLYDYARKRGIPVGCNVESVAVTKREIEASIGLLNSIKSIINSQN